MEQVNFTTVNRALDTLLAYQNEVDRTKQVYELNCETAQRENYQRGRAILAAEKQQTDAANARYSSAVQSAHASADALAGQTVAGLEELVTELRVTPASGAVQSPREMDAIATDFNRLASLQRTFETLNGLETEASQVSKPIAQWIWLGMVGVGAIALFVMGITVG